MAQQITYSNKTNNFSSRANERNSTGNSYTHDKPRRSNKQSYSGKVHDLAPSPKSDLIMYIDPGQNTFGKVLVCALELYVGTNEFNRANTPKVIDLISDGGLNEIVDTETSTAETTANLYGFQIVYNFYKKEYQSWGNNHKSRVFLHKCKGLWAIHLPHGWNPDACCTYLGKRKHSVCRIDISDWLKYAPLVVPTLHVSHPARKALARKESKLAHYKRTPDILSSDDNNPFVTPTIGIHHVPAKPTAATDGTLSPILVAQKGDSAGHIPDSGFSFTPINPASLFPSQPTFDSHSVSFAPATTEKSPEKTLEKTPDAKLTASATTLPSTSANVYHPHDVRKKLGYAMPWYAARKFEKFAKICDTEKPFVGFVQGKKFDEGKYGAEVGKEITKAHAWAGLHLDDSLELYHWASQQGLLHVWARYMNAWFKNTPGLKAIADQARTDRLNNKEYNKRVEFAQQNTCNHYWCYNSWLDS